VDWKISIGASQVCESAWKKWEWNSKSLPETTVTIEQALMGVAVIIMGNYRSKSYNLVRDINCETVDTERLGFYIEIKKLNSEEIAVFAK